MKKSIAALVLFIASLTGYAPSIQAQSYYSEPPAITPSTKSQLSPSSAGLIVAGSYLGGWAALVGGARTGSGALALAGAGGIFLAPSFGYGYSGELGKGLGLSLMSTLGAGLFISTIDFCIYTCDDKEDQTGTALLGLALHFGSTLLALIDAPNAARRTNQKRRNYIVAPTIVGQNVGLGVAGRF